jgi:hypothetical protein
MPRSRFASVRFHMAGQISLQCEGDTTLGTGMRPESGMLHLVLAQVAPRLETFATGEAAVSPLLCVGFGMAAKAGVVHKALLADGAGVGPVSCMVSHVNLQVMRPGEGFSANCTTEGLLAMFVLVVILKLVAGNKMLAAFTALVFCAINQIIKKGLISAIT